MTVRWQYFLFQENIKVITKEYYRLTDLLELERDDYTEEESEEDAENDDTDVEDGDHDIQPVKKPAEEKAREELWRYLLRSCH